MVHTNCIALTVWKGVRNDDVTCRLQYVAMYSPNIILKQRIEETLIHVSISNEAMHYECNHSGVLNQH